MARTSRRSGGRVARRVLLGVLLLGLAVNALAWAQAWAMTHYTTGSTPAPVIERLSLGDKVGMVLGGVRVPRPENTHTPAALGLAYQTVTIPAGGGETLKAWVVDAAPSRGVVLLFPGYATPK